MANLFLIHTPFQLFVAQQIIKQEKLQDNIMLKNYVPGNKHFLDIYDLMIIPELWAEQIQEPCFLGWALVKFEYLPSPRALYTTKKRMKQFLSDFDQIIEKRKIKSIYLGEISNTGLQLITYYYSKKGLEICFFEEGSSHYKYRSVPEMSNFMERLYYKFLEVIMDTLLYKPLLGISYANHYYYNHKYEELPFTERYSIIPCYHTDRDKTISVKMLLSDQLHNYILNEIKGIDFENKKVYLFISSLVYEITTDDDFIVEEAVIEDMAKQIEPDSVLLIKFHPREKKEHEERMLSIFKKFNFEYRILGRTYNIPVEFYLQYFSFSKIYAFANSSIFYNGYIFPTTEMVRLDLNYLEKYREHGLPNLDRVQRYCDVFTKSINYFTELANRKG